MRILPLVLAAFAFALPAKADKFWLNDPALPKGSPSPEFVHGVLLAESAEGYHVRMVGGEILLRRAAVAKIEKDDLTIEQIVAAEKQDHERLAKARAGRKAAPAAARRRKDVGVAEAAASKGEAPAAAPAPAFDPILGRVAPGELLSTAELQRDLQLAWTLTKDRRFLKALRQLRRAN